MLDTGKPIARREFIKKSLVASSGLFVGMAIGEKLLTPELTAQAAPNSSSSRGGGKWDKDKKKKKKKDKGGWGW